LLLVVTVVAPAAEPAGAGGGPTSAPLTPEDGALFGAAVAPGSREAPYQPLLDLEAKLGRRLAIDRYDRPFGTAFPDGREEEDVAAGRIPMVSWGPVATGEVNRGSWDAQVRLRARAIRKLGQPVLIDWFSDAANPRNGAVSGDASQYVAAWRRLHRIFTEEDARNAVWVWCADAADFGNGTADVWYPGDDSVDWICADGYNPRNPARPDSEVLTFEDLFTPFHAWASTHDKPMMVGRYGTVEDAPGDKSSWVEGARQALTGPLSGIDAVVYDSTQQPGPYPEAPTDDWRMDSSDESMAAFAAMGADPWFTPAVEATLPETVIDSGPQRTVGQRDASFVFSASGNPTGFECHLDRGRWQPCQSPLNLSGLPDGKHNFEVRALGQGGRADPTPARRDWVVDTTGPLVTVTSPDEGANDVKPGAEIFATFSEALDPDSVVGDAFIVVAEQTGQVVAGKVTYDPATRKAKFRPKDSLAPMFAYKATIKAAVKDLVGNSMAEEKVWSFRTTVDTSMPEPPSQPQPPPGPAPAPEPPAPKPPARPAPPDR
jgi:hypothetical protein